MSLREARLEEPVVQMHGFAVFVPLAPFPGRLPFVQAVDDDIERIQNGKAEMAITASIRPKNMVPESPIRNLGG